MMKNRIAKILAIFLLLLIVAAFSIYRFFFPSLKKETIRINGIERTYFYHVPDDLKTNPGVVFVLHGATMTPRVMRIVTWKSFEKLADRFKDKLVVYPAAYKRYWNDCRKAGDFDARRLRLDEVDFIKQIIARLDEKFHIDRSRIFASGYSNGGQLCFKLAMEAPEWFAGFAIYSANLPTPANNVCHPKNIPVSILVVNGTKDPVNPYNGGDVQVNHRLSRGAVLSTEETIRYWRGLAGLQGPPLQTTYPDLNRSDNSQAVRFDYGIRGKTKIVSLIKVINGGHHVSNPQFTWWPSRLGNLNKDIDVPKITWEFFKSAHEAK